MEIIKEVNSVKCVHDINILISYNVRTLCLNNWKTGTLAQKQSIRWNCKGQAVHSSTRLYQKHSCHFDSTMSMLPHVNAVCKSAFYNLCNISRIKKFLSSKFTEILVHAFVASKLDYCNSLLYNVPKYVLKKLQSVQNVAAHLITCSRKYDHIAPVLSNRHWLPVNEHIKFKILPLYTNKHLSTFKIWLLFLIWSPMGLELLLSLLLAYATVYLTTSVHVIIYLNFISSTIWLSV